MWWKKYESLNLLGGRINYISDDLEDMIEISYSDGMFIDIGKPTRENIYYITVVATNDASGWKNPLLELPVSDKEDLYERIQETVLQFRSC